MPAVCVSNTRAWKTNLRFTLHGSSNLSTHTFPRRKKRCLITVLYNPGHSKSQKSLETVYWHFLEEHSPLHAQEELNTDLNHSNNSWSTEPPNQLELQTALQQTEEGAARRGRGWARQEQYRKAGMALPAMETTKEELKQEDLLLSLTIPFFPEETLLYVQRVRFRAHCFCRFPVCFFTSTTKKQH